MLEQCQVVYLDIAAFRSMMYYHSVLTSWSKVMFMARWRLKEIAKPQRWTQRALAKETGLALGTINSIWNNTATRADLKTIEALAQVLKVQPGELIGPGEQGTEEDK